MIDFFDIILEAKSNKQTKKKTITVKKKEDTKDYTAELPENDNQDSQQENNDESTDYTDSSNNDTTYDEDEIELEPKNVDETEDDNSMGDGDNEQDYTDDANSDEEDDNDSDTDNSSNADDINNGDGGDYTDNSDGDNVDDNLDNNKDAADDNAKNKSLMKDFINLYNIIKNTTTKISNNDKTDIIKNKVYAQVTYNLNNLQKYIFDFITFTFQNNKYVNNLYQFNFFLEAFKINIEMMKKINDLGSN